MSVRLEVHVRSAYVVMSIGLNVMVVYLKECTAS